MQSSLASLVSRYLSDLEPSLIEQGIPLNRRALHAALSFAEDLVIEVNGGTRENPIGQPWFDAIHFEVLAWYHERYGDAMAANPDGRARGIVLFGGTALRITFPLAVIRPASAPLTNRLYFPEDLRDDENPERFLDASVGLHTFSESERTRLRTEIAAIVGRTRRLNKNLRFADLSPKGRQLVNRVMWTLCSAAESIGAGSNDRLALAVWELNLTAELALKVFLLQRKVRSPKIHDVRKLHDLAEAAGLPAHSATALARFPSVRSAMRFRYGEKPPPALPTVVELYDAAMSLAEHCASHCAHRLWIKAEGWIEVRKIGSVARGA